MIVCASCSKENEPQYRFCLGCGAELSSVEPTSPGHEPAIAVPSPSPAPPVAPSLLAAAAASRPASARQCPVCGHVAHAEVIFCSQCGTRIESKRPAATAHPTLAKQSDASVIGRLVLVRSDGSEGGAHPLHEGDNPIGRAHGALFDADGFLSPEHARIVLNAAGAVVRDLGSLNGVFVKLSAEEEIAHGAIFRLGQELLRFDEIKPPEPLDDGTQVMGSPNPGYWGRLALIVGRGLDGSAFPLFGDGVVLGRERGDILFPEDGYVSGSHARVSMRDGRFFLQDLNSSNGTFLRTRGERTLKSGSFVLMGQQLFRLVF